MAFGFPSTEFTTQIITDIAFRNRHPGFDGGKRLIEMSLLDHIDTDLEDEEQIEQRSRYLEQLELGNRVPILIVEIALDSTVPTVPAKQIPLLGALRAHGEPALCRIFWPTKSTSVYTRIFERWYRRPFFRGAANA